VEQQGFSTSQTASLTGVNEPVLHYWNKTGFVLPTVQKAKGSGTRRRYSFTDLLALRVARELREAGIPLQGIRRAVQYLQDKGYESPLAECFLVADPAGKDVFVQQGDEVLSCLRERGQRMLCIVVDLDRVRAEVQEAVHNLDKAAPTKAEGKPRKHKAG
jgi:DNA-binding transcriptional MerR regulator